MCSLKRQVFKKKIFVVIFGTCILYYNILIEMNGWRALVSINHVNIVVNHYKER